MERLKWLKQKLQKKKKNKKKNKKKAPGEDEKENTDLKPNVLENNSMPVQAGQNSKPPDNATNNNNNRGNASQQLQGKAALEKSKSAMTLSGKISQEPPRSPGHHHHRDDRHHKPPPRASSLRKATPTTPLVGGGPPRDRRLNGVSGRGGVSGSPAIGEKPEGRRITNQIYEQKRLDKNHASPNNNNYNTNNELYNKHNNNHNNIRNNNNNIHHRDTTSSSPRVANSGIWRKKAKEGWQILETIYENEVTEVKLVQHPQFGRVVAKLKDSSAREHESMVMRKLTGLSVEQNFRGIVQLLGTEAADGDKILIIMEHVDVSCCVVLCCVVLCCVVLCCGCCLSEVR